jgi:hypothetical protein
MKIKFCILYLLLISFLTQAQERRIPNIPDIPGYQTLICDFHMHTVFSDGRVWPTVRVDEAWREGLDAIAITDHLEYQIHNADIRTDLNRSWQMAKEYASDKNVLVISGTEISKGMPPGHLNALFIKDAAPILNDDFKKAIEVAAKQGAFIIWNHPGWKTQQPDTVKWWDEHTYLQDQGWLRGIEVKPGHGFSEAIDFANERGLTMIGASDMHAPSLKSNWSDKGHRNVTLVFATERSEEGIRDALFSGKTAVYNGEKVIGKASFLDALFLQSVQLHEIDKSQGTYSIMNNSDFIFDLLFEGELNGDWNKEISLKPGYESVLKLPEDINFDSVVIHVQNFITGTESVVSMLFSSIPMVQK